MLRSALRAAAAVVFLVAGVTQAEAQTYPVAFLPDDHWALDAVRRLSGVGLAPAGYDLSQRTPTQRDVGTLLEQAAADSSAYQPLAVAWRDRFRAEFARGPSAFSLAGSAASAGWHAAEGRMAPGWGYGFGFPGVPWNEPDSLADTNEVVGSATLQASWQPVALRVTTIHPGGRGEELDEAYGVMKVGPAALWAGRRHFGWSPGVGGGIVMNSGRYDSFGAQISPFRLPGFLGRIGPVAFEFAVGMDDLDHSFEDAGFFATRGSVSPHRRLHLGVTRAALFGGEGNAPVDLFAILSMLIGKHAGEVSELDNQLVAVDFSYRLPTERWLPLRGYIEWGFEDSAGAFYNVPGIVAGLDMPAVPGVPQLAIAVEHARFARSCCGNPIWYRHSNLQSGWTQDGAPLGRELGGHGNEWLAIGRWHGPGLPVRVRAAAFLRDRGIENLYAEARTGRSRGGSVGLEAELTQRIRLQGAASVEDGSGWREVEFSIALRAIR